MIFNKDTFKEIESVQDKAFDLVLTDPPYDLKKEQIIFLQQQFMRISKTGYIVFSNPENQWLCEQYGFWIKPISTKNTSKRYSRFVEMIFFLSNLK